MCRYSKLFYSDPKTLCDALATSLSLYKRVTELVERWKVTTFDEETELAREMVQLLPLKLAKIQSTGISFQE